MKKIDCDIYRDLFPSYIKEEISDTTKIFVDNHLKECQSCKAIFEDMKSTEKGEGIERGEINVLKKFNRQMCMLKYFILLLIIVIVSSLGIVGYRYYKQYQNGVAVYNLMSKSSESIEKFALSNNFIFSCRTNDLAYTTYYKDKKIKIIEEPLKSYIGNNYVHYGKNDDKNLEMVTFTKWDRTLNVIDYSSNPSSDIETYMRMYGLNNYLLEERLKLEKVELGDYVIDENEYKGSQCYIIKKLVSGRIYEQFYISKENNLLLRYEFLTYNGEIYTEYEYTYSTDCVTDEDLKIKEDFSKYNLERDSYCDKDEFDKAIKFINEF